jgi:hypothetical protein
MRGHRLVIGRNRFSSLSIALVEIEGDVELGLAREQFLEVCVVLEGPVMPEGTEGPDYIREHLLRVVSGR